MYRKLFFFFFFFFFFFGKVHLFAPSLRDTEVVIRCSFDFNLETTSAPTQKKSRGGQPNNYFLGALSVTVKMIWQSSKVSEANMQTISADKSIGISIKGFTRIELVN